MFRLNNKGQSLVMFIILIPIFLLIITLVYDVGNALYEKNRLSNTSYMVIEYGLDNIDDIDENDLIDLALKNVYDLNEISVFIEDDKINIKLSKDIKGIIGNMFGFNLITTTSEYEGKIVGKEKKIERIK
ncbi:MAG: pilus assembly protein [Bacilli bacterium]|nr:pilus assembly protein [Bacilli bacterium]